MAFRCIYYSNIHVTCELNCITRGYFCINNKTLFAFITTCIYNTVCGVTVYHDLVLEVDLDRMRGEG